MVETAARQSKATSYSLFPRIVRSFHTNDRMEMVNRRGHLPNVTRCFRLETIWSPSYFPSYFLKGRIWKWQSARHVGATLFLKTVIPTLQLTKRYVGQEPTSPVTVIMTLELLWERLRGDYRRAFCRGLSGECDAGARCRSRLKNVDGRKQLVPAALSLFKHFIG